MDLPQKKYEGILKAQTFNPIYTKLECLYNILPYPLRPTASSPTHIISHVANRMIGAMHHKLGHFPSQVPLYGTTGPYKWGPPPMYGYPPTTKYLVGYSSQKIMTVKLGFNPAWRI